MAVHISDNWMRALKAVADALQEQDIDGIGRNVRVQQRPWTPAQTRPGCYVTPADREHSESLSSHAREAYGYGCMVTVVRGSASSRGDSPDRTTGWIEVVGRLFHKKRFWQPRTCDALLPATVTAPTQADINSEHTNAKPVDAVSLVVRAWVREQRN